MAKYLEGRMIELGSNNLCLTCAFTEMSYLTQVLFKLCGCALNAGKE